VRRAALLFEYLLIFVAAPLLVVLVRQRWLMIALLWLGALAAWRLSSKAANAMWAPVLPGLELRRMAWRFACIAPVLTLGTWLVLPEQFLELPLHRPQIWLMVMVGYPLLSVWPQEMLFRRFALTRYAPLFGTGLGFVAASSLAFGFVHIIFLNPFAVLLSTAGGALFALEFARHRSLPLVCLEHALYGCLLFSVGLGRFFYTGSAWGQ